ncbi:hypothetical protein NE237_026049 [Protea cynaroides]|uniref:Serine/threonine-protein kinase RIO2 n=1 Tax=Protea cynaroides TaxID=273540 RepID=A0A9Q0K2C3_9MAGN|nr:hypothetical protein NE237_026049 [Protea cynaroides]
MEDKIYPSKPLLNPPPKLAGNANPSFPATKGQLYNRPNYRPQGKLQGRRRSCCCICCIWTTLLIVALILLAAIAGAAIWIVYRPQRPTFSVAAVRISQFNVTSSKLNSNLDLSISVRNPNKKLVFFYDPSIVTLNSDSVYAGNGTFPGFILKTKNTTVLNTTVSSVGEDLDSSSASSLKSDQKKGVIPLAVQLDTKVKVKIGGLKTSGFMIRVKCDGLKSNVPKGCIDFCEAGFTRTCCIVTIILWPLLVLFLSFWSGVGLQISGMKLDVEVLRYLSKDDFRVLTAVEMGMRNHEIVPAELVDRIARLKHGGTYKVMKNLLKHKLLHHDSSKYDGFRLTYLGYDYLAIKTLVNRGVFTAIGRQIGVGKESDIFEVATEDGTILAMKLHRLGRISFRAVKTKRDYLMHRSSYNWLYLSRLAALKEYAFMKALEEHGFPVPSAVDCNRHCVIMSLVQGYPLVQVRELQNHDTVFETIIGLIVRMAEHGLIHCDFNEFNIMIDDNEKLTMIDFPQMVSVSHRNAQMYFDRDVECIFKFFRKRFNMSFQENTDECDESDSDMNENGRPCFSSIAKSAGSLDKELAASGFTRKDQDEIEKFTECGGEKDSDSDDTENLDGACFPDDCGANISDSESLQPVDLQELSGVFGDKEDDMEGNQHSCEAVECNGPETSEPDEKEDNQDINESDDALMKSLNKQRRRAIAAAQGGRKAFASRNSYKDKGGKTSQNSKIQKQMRGW